ncbi:MAG: hypothetical protein JW716_02360 [Candidatus Aenigmarchaeota archaeon]|nr:hypothetical protein [Candidatus Aenigmarchaeota archaeon]
MEGRIFCGGSLAISGKYCNGMGIEKLPRNCYRLQPDVLLLAGVSETDIGPAAIRKVECYLRENEHL